MKHIVRSLAIDHLVWMYMYMPLRRKQYIADHIETLKEASGEPKIIDFLF